jgi:hypothetical protein
MPDYPPAVSFDGKRPEPRAAGERLRPVRAAAGWLAVVFALAVSGCATQRPDGTVVRHYFPYAVVTTPPVAPEGQRISVREIRSYGLAFGNGGTLVGYGKEHHVILPPDGRMYLVVQTDEQFQRAKELIEKHPELGLFVTKNQDP